MRFLLVWIPDWPVRAALGSSSLGLTAVLQAGIVLACSPAARELGVRRGQRRRVAQGRAPGLLLLDADPLREERLFLPVLRLLEEWAPGVQPLHPGLAALRTRGAARYYGGEEEAAVRLLDELSAEGYAGARIGIADGLFTAEQAARRATESPVRIVPSDRTADFLAPLPVQALGDDEIGPLLIRLGVRTLSAFSALREEDVRDRFGERGVRLHARAAGKDPRPIRSLLPEAERGVRLPFDTPLLQADQIAFAVRQSADAFVDGLGADDLVCTEVRIEFTDDAGRVTSRVWMHPGFFEAGDLVNRVRWQLEGFVPEEDDGRHPAGIVEVRIVPLRVESADAHQPGLFGQGQEERLHHAVSRVQALLGHRGVLVPVLAGGRRAAERQRFIPWGDRQEPQGDPALPWPGGLPPPYPGEIFAPPRAIAVTDAQGEVPGVDERGTLSAPPAFLAHTPVLSWAGPWPLHERGWDKERMRIAHRFQVVDSERRAWLLLWEKGSWWAEGRYH